MAFKNHGPGNCCCGGCPSCANITHLIISDLNSGGVCADGCENQNGTYVFRSAGDPMPANCTWIIPLRASDCGHTCVNGDSTQWDIGLVACCLVPVRKDFSVELLFSGSSVVVRVTGAFHYRITHPDCTGYVGDGPIQCGNYGAVWEKEFADCASISGPLPLVSTSGGDCNADYADTGDLCGLFGATVEVG